MGLAGSSEINTTALPLSNVFKTLFAYKTGSVHFNPVKSYSSIKQLLHRIDINIKIYTYLHY